MIGLIIWIIGMVLTLKAVIEILTTRGGFGKKLIAVILIFATSWIGLLFYYLYARPRMESWLR